MLRSPRNEPRQIKFQIWNRKRPRVSGCSRGQSHYVGGVDGTRTRDPRRDKPVLQVNAGAGLRPIQIPKGLKFEISFARCAASLFHRLLHERQEADHEIRVSNRARGEQPAGSLTEGQDAVPGREYAS